MLFNPNPATAYRRDRAAQLYWTRDGRGWVLKLGKRKLGTVSPDRRFPACGGRGGQTGGFRI